jgi:hypothetical protein
VTKVEKYLFAGMGLALIISIMAVTHLYDRLGAAETERQLRGELTVKEQALQAANKERDQAQATLLDQKKLNDEYLKTNFAKNAELEKIRKEMGLHIDSLSSAVAHLEGVVTAQQGSSSSGTINGKHFFRWQDDLGRFHLFSPDIDNPKATEFTYQQDFQIDAAILKQPAADGSLRIQSITLNEIDKNGNIIKKADLDLAKSSFRYVPGEDPTIVGPAQRFLLGLTSGGEAEISWEPMRLRNDSLGLNVVIFGDKNEQFLGGGVRYYPKLKWVKSEVGVGFVAGYSTTSKLGVRLDIAITFASISKHKTS